MARHGVQISNLKKKIKTHQSPKTPNFTFEIEEYEENNKNNDV